jgi:hypothetical protein
VKHIVIAAVVVGALASPAAAKEKVKFVESAPVKDQPAVTLNPAKAYILVRSDVAIPLHLMRVASAEDQAIYDRLRAEALVEARGKYAKKLASYERDQKAYESSLKTGPKVAKPVKPVEPTEANFEFTPFGLLTGVSIGPLNRFAKGSNGEKTSIYLQEITPGRYRIYGMMQVIPNSGATGRCFCMGSVAFDAIAGEITDLGRFSARELPKRDGSDSAMPPPLAVEFNRAVAGMPLDPRIAKASVTPAVLRPVGKLPNYYGLSIDRFPAIDGVMRYDRDRIVDLTAGN